ncbi:mechanosensitive ion channel family protein [Elizabethkingia anophelis]|uniref:Mechanosensitive ion channel protein MscS n=1 Tax=Elizabethkingia anophelis TaxID=1117645 RepID=A0AAP7RHP6_9FLAO|nr:mechanosensitive ion channel domain-containing protein [Elizabethkingia anophelis]AKH96310.1 mechanosensitive ion channel protein MscS [Elizabethkingia anophelis FMS-007]AQW93890.1 mechanosensitive ion channel protein MscS [Elizabethkingia anophelis]AQW97761.1 mechanosensitive ion channel protein MscS [Elizabethkingia anophelis]AQX01349.1 mechanosensitive ion channel protein MscS [Elizabethkingia anophelis]AQX88323.1 mechanosensitive ion channel protein MscS [Elizabethkingia anophelis]
MELTLKEILEYHIFALGQYSLTVYQLISSAVIVLIGLGIVRIFKSLIYKSEKIDVGKKFAFAQILKYIIIVFTAILAFRTLGVDVSPLLLGGSVILVGIGLGLQNLFLDFISGVIILLDRSIKVDDVVEIENVVGKVQQINIRTSTILTRDNKSMIIPNSILTKNKIVNMSYDDDVANFGISIGVGYDSDVDLVMKLMLEAAKEHPEVFQEKPAVARLSNFGDSSLDFSLFFNSRYLFKAEAIKSDLRLSILNKFRENNIDIPFPIRTLYTPDLLKQKENQ